MTASDLYLEKQVCHSLYTAANALIRAYRPLLEPLGLTYPQYVVMMSLWQRDAVSVKHLSEHTRLDSGTLTPLLKRLESKGLLSRNHSSDDERQKVITLTEEGRQLKKRALKVPEQMICRTNIPMEEALHLKQMCEILFRNLET